MNVFELQMSVMRFWLDATSAMLTGAVAATSAASVPDDLDRKVHRTRETPAVRTVSPWWLSRPVTAPRPAQADPPAVIDNPLLAWWSMPARAAEWSAASLAPPPPRAPRPSELMAPWITPWIQVGLIVAPGASFAPWLTPAAGTETGPIAPFMAAYRTASGHATAAVLRAMADAVEPDEASAAPQFLQPAPLAQLPMWPWLLLGGRG